MTRIGAPASASGARALAALLVTSAIVGAAPRPAAAASAPVSDTEAESRAELEAGLAAYQRSDFASAIAHFERAYALHPSPQYLYAWAQAARSAGDCASAVDLYRRFIAAGATGDSLEAARQNEARCREQLAEATPEPTSVPNAPAEPAELEPPSRSAPPTKAPTRAEPTTSTARDTRSAGPIDPAGLALVVTGTASALAGATVLAISGVRRAAQARTSDYERFDTFDREIDRLDLAGGITLGIGAALAVGGAIRLALVRRRAQRNALVIPTLHADGTPMLVLRIEL